MAWAASLHRNGTVRDPWTRIRGRAVTNSTHYRRPSVQRLPAIRPRGRGISGRPKRLPFGLGDQERFAPVGYGWGRGDPAVRERSRRQRGGHSGKAGDRGGGGGQALVRA